MIKKFFVKNYKILTGIILGMALTSTTVYAAYCVWAKDVGFASNTGLASTNVQDAIDELNSKTNTCQPPAPAVTSVCKRATTLHSETCQNATCTSGGETYSNGETITYGSLGTAGVLATGDAFDCDVNADGTFDPNTERFYYLTDLDYDNEWGVLIYYSNTSQPGILINSNTIPSSYGDSTSPNYASGQLPKASDWPNVSIYENHYGPSCKYIKTRSGSMRGCEDFSGKAARLASLGEVRSACNIVSSSQYERNSNETSIENLSGCSFMTENTKYANSSNLLGYWLLGISDVYSSAAAFEGSQLINYRFDKTGPYGVRPVIEVAKSDIDY